MAISDTLKFDNLILTFNNILLININPQMQQQQHPPSQPQLQSELLEMGFKPQSVKAALKNCTTLDQALNHIMTSQNKQMQEDMAVQNEEEFEDEQQQDYKMVFLVRMDLKMTLGKIAELVATSTLEAYKRIEKQSEVDQLKEYIFHEWNQNGQRKIVLRCNSQQEIVDLSKKIIQKELPSKLQPEKQSYEKKEKPKKDKKNRAKGEGEGEGKDKEIKSSIEDKQKNYKQNPKEQIEEQNIIKETEIELKKEEKKQKQIQKEIKIEQQQSPEIILTCLGPASESDIDPLTKQFKLY